MGRSSHVLLLTPVGGGGTVALASSDTISITDSATLLSGANLSVSDTVSISDQATLTVPGGISKGNAGWGGSGWGGSGWGSLPSPAIVSPLLYISANDTISLADQATLESGAVLAASDTISVTDAATLESGAALASSDTINIADQATLTITGTISISSTDTISISDEATLQVFVVSYNWYMYGTTPQNSIVTGAMTPAEAEAYRIAGGFLSKIPIGPLTTISPATLPQPVT